MAEKQNTPEIRFKGFTDPWEQRKLGELLLFQNGFNGSSKSFGSGIPLISVMDVLDDEFITHETVRGKARLNCEEASRYCVEYGDVLFQRSSENQEDAGTSNVYLDQHVSSAFGGFVIRGKKVGEYNPIFIKYLLGSPFIREQITHRAQGAQHINVSQDTLADVVLLMPSMHEQEAAGLVFLHLDNLITLHQRKHDKLCTVKRSMLDKMFPKPGETEPEIRFKGFTDAWEQRKLGEVADRYDNLRIPITASERVPGSTPYYGANGIQDYVEGFTHQGEFVLIAEDGASDLDNYPTMCINGIIWVNNHAHVIQGRKGITDNHFIAWSIKRCDIKPMLTGGTRAKLNAEVLMGMRISTPNHAEQISIGSFFEHLDSLITLHQRKLDLLKNTKKSLLDKMFV